MAINPINLSNTFAQLVTTTRQCGDELNLLKSGEYVKEAGILNITAPGTSLVANGALFYDNVSVSKSLTVTGNVESKLGYIFPDGSTQITAAQSSEYSNSAYAHANSVYVLANNTANTLTTTLAELQTHESNYNNPHKVSAEQLNLADIATTGSYNDLKDIPEPVGVMVGANSDSDGSSGLVPQPKAGDEKKVLMGDGTWGEMSGMIFGSTVFSLLPLTEAGLHLLDGSLLKVGGIYDEFVAYIGSLFEKQNPQTKWFKTKEIILPTFNANTQNGITISDSRGNTTNLQAIFNGSTESVVIGAWNTYWIKIDYAKNTFLSSYTIQADNNSIPEYPSAWTLQGSNDGVTWKVIQTKTGIVFSLNETKTFPVSQSEPYKQYRLLFSGGVVSAKGGELKKVSFNASEVIFGYENSLFVTEEQWQMFVANYGVCGKFVHSESGVRLPKVTGFVEGTLDSSALGDLVEAGLPNITGSFSTSKPGVSASGAFTSSGQGAVGGAADGSQASGVYWAFNASQSNALYGKSETVQPQAIKGYLYIVLATTTKTNVQVNIDNVVTDLNNKVDKDLSNISPEGAAKSIDWIYPDWTAKLNLNTGVDNPIETKGWVLMKNNSLDTVTGYINGIEVFHNYGLSGKWEDYNSLSFPVNTGDVVRLNGGTLLYFPCRGII